MGNRLFALFAAAIVVSATSSCDSAKAVGDSFYATVYGTAYYLDQGAGQASFSIDLGTYDRISQEDLRSILDRFSTKVDSDFYEADFEIRIERNGLAGRNLLYYTALQSGSYPDSYVFYQTDRDFIIPDSNHSCRASLKVFYPDDLQPERTSAIYDHLTVIGGKLADNNISDIINDLNQPRYLSPGWVEGRLEIDVFATEHPAASYPTSYYIVWRDNGKGYLWDETTIETTSQ